MHRFSRGYLSRGDKNLYPKHLVWAEFAETTTCHGVKEILRSKKCFWKIFWTFSVLVHVGLLVVGCTKVIMDYFTIPTVTRISVTHSISMDLPHLAFCLPNSFDNRKMMRVPKIVREEAQCGDFGRLQFSPKVTKYLTVMNKTVKDFVEEYSYKCEDILESGGFAHEIKYDFCSNAKIIHHKHYGLCYVIKAGPQVIPGVQGGYRLHFTLPKPLINCTRMDKRDMWSFSNGLAIELGHDYRHLNLNSLLISRDKFASVSLRSEYHVRVNDNGQCTESRKSNFSSGTTCFLWCSVKIQNDACSCGLYGVSDIFDRNLRLCNFHDQHCLKFNASFNESIAKVTECQKNCKPLCQEWEYKPSVTYINMRSKNLRRTRFQSSTEQSRMDSEEYTHQRSENVSHIRVIVGYSAMEYKKVEEVRSFTAFMAVSSLGGQAGLWMGCSILTVIHAFTYCLWALGIGCTNRIKTIVKKDSVHFIDEHGKLQGGEVRV